MRNEWVVLKALSGDRMPQVASTMVLFEIAKQWLISNRPSFF